MFFIKMIKKIDQVICCYLGLEHDEAHPSKLQWAKRRLIVTHTSPYKRHAMQSTWEDYHQLPQVLPNALGFTLGKTIAKQLVISFKEPIIRINQDESS